MDSINNTKNKKEKGRYPQLPTRKHRLEDGTSNVDIAKKDEDGEESKGPSLSLDQSIKNNKRKMDNVDDDVPSKKVKSNSSTPSPSEAAAASSSNSRSSYIGVTYQSDLLKYEAKLIPGEYTLGLFDLACDAAYMHDVAYRITGGGSSNKSKNLLIANDSDKIDYHCNWLEKERDAKEEAVGTADDNNLNFLTPSQYDKARTLEMSGRMNEKVQGKSELEIVIRKEILNLAVAYLSTTQKQREGGVEKRDKKKVKSSLHKKKSWTPDIEEDDQNSNVHPTPQQEDDELEALRKKQHNETKKMALAIKLERMMSGEYEHQNTSQGAERHSYVPHQIENNIAGEELNNESLQQLLLYQLAARQQQQRLGSIGFPSSNGINPSSLEQLLLLASARSNGIANENIVRQMEQQQALREMRPRPWGRQHDTHINHLEKKVDDPDIVMYRNLINEAKRASLAQKLSAFQGKGNDGGLTTAQARTKEDRAEDQATSECSALLLELARGGKGKEGNNNEQYSSSEQKGCDSTTTKSSSLKSSEDIDDLDDNKVLKEGNGEATPSLQQQILLAARVQELQGVQRHAQTPQNVSTMLIQRLMQREMEERSNQALEKFNSDLIHQAQSIIRDRQMETQSTTGGNNSFSAPNIHRHILNESLSRGQINQGRQINEAGIQQALNRYEQIARLPYDQVAHLVNLAKSANEQERK